MLGAPRASNPLSRSERPEGGSISLAPSTHRVSRSRGSLKAEIEVKHPFEPMILAFCCRWCSYAAADLAGSMRIQYPSKVRIMMIPCTGRLHIIHLLYALERGTDGVFVSGCLMGDCHYISGNEKATRRAAYVKKLLEEIGMEPGRVEIFYNSSAMGSQFAKTCREFTERIRQIGPIFRDRKQQKAADRQGFQDDNV